MPSIHAPVENLKRMIAILYFWTFDFVRGEIEDFSTLPNCVVPQDTLKEMLDNMLNKETFTDS